VTFSGRGLMPETGAPYTLESLLPGVFLEPVYDQKGGDEDDEGSDRGAAEPETGKQSGDRGGPEFVQGLCAGLDCVLAPASVTLDCLEAYFDPRLTPLDFLDWLAGWVGLSLDQNWSEQQRRALVMEAGELYRWQGTTRGIIEHVRLYTGVVPEVYDSGGVAWSTTSGAPLPGTAAPQLTVQVTIDADDDLDLSRLDAIVAAVKPAHVPHTIKVVKRVGPPETSPSSPVVPRGDSRETLPFPPAPPTQGDGQERLAGPPAPPAQGDGQDRPLPPGGPAPPWGQGAPRPPTGPAGEGDS
jgi:phage tail-like protein